MNTCNMAETISRDVDVGKDKLLSSSEYKYQNQNLPGNTPYVKLPACWTEQNKDIRIQNKLLSKQSSCLLVNFLPFALVMCQHHFDINIRA